MRVEQSGGQVVSSGLYSKKIERSDAPMDGGWGFEEPEAASVIATAAPAELERTDMRFPAWREGNPAAAEAAANVALVDSVISPVVIEAGRAAISQGVSYAGEIPAVPDVVETGFTPFPTLP